MWRQPSGWGRLRSLAVAAVAVLAFAAPASADSSRLDCGVAVLDAWTKGTLGPGYSPECYEEAIDALPEDLRAYTSAADDITRAGIAASRAGNARSPSASARRLAEAPATEEQLRAFPTEVALLAGVLVVLVPAGVAAALVRRWRAR